MTEKPMTIFTEQDVEAAAKALYKLAWREGAHWPPHNEGTYRRFVEKARIALTAAEANMRKGGWVAHGTSGEHPYDHYKLVDWDDEKEAFPIGTPVLIAKVVK